MLKVSRNEAWELECKGVDVSVRLTTRERFAPTEKVLELRRERQQRREAEETFILCGS